MDQMASCAPIRRFFQWLHVVLLVSIAFFAAIGQLHAQEDPPPRTLKVGVYVSPPFVTAKAGDYSGMAIELWEKIAAKLQVASTYEEFPNYAKLIEATASGKVDVAVTNLSITESRAKIIDFTHPWFDAGLRVMVHSTPQTSVSDIIGDLGDAGHLETYAWIAIIILAATVLLTTFDRKFDRDFPARWRDGLAESFYHVMSVATSGKAPRRNLFGWAGRIWQGFWMVCGVAVIAYITSSITSVMTAAHISNQIDSVADLQGKIVGVRVGSVAEEYMRSVFVGTMPFDHITEAADALLEGEISAIVGDSPVLEYYAASHPDLPLEVIGNTFQPDKYGFAFTAGHALTKPASVAIIGAYESGDIEKLRSKYFGVMP